MIPTTFSKPVKTFKYYRLSRKPGNGGLVKIAHKQSQLPNWPVGKLAGPSLGVPSDTIIKVTGGG